MSKLVDSLVQELSSKLTDQPFYTVRQLVDGGVFGSMSAARAALCNGSLPFVKISQRRFLVPRSALLKHLRSNLSHNINERASDESQA